MPARPPSSGSTSSIGEQLHVATTLAHTVPGVVLALTCCNGEQVSVGYGRLDAQLTPCQLRCALLAGSAPGVPSLADAVTGVEVASGLDHLGGGLYGRGVGLAGSERWFVTTLTHTRVAGLIADTPHGLPHETCAVRLTPDPELGTTAVRVSAAGHTPANPAELDEVAYWVLSACLVGELDESRAIARGSIR